jgi:hypothetical protein
LLAGQEHGRTIPLADFADAAETSAIRRVCSDARRHEVLGDKTFDGWAGKRGWIIERLLQVSRASC